MLRSFVVQFFLPEKLFIVKLHLRIVQYQMTPTNRSNYKFHPLFFHVCLTSLTSGSFEKISWASVQLHCQRYVNEQKVNLQTSISNNKSNDSLATNVENLTLDSTALIATKGETGQTVYTSKPCVLFCDLILHDGESKTCL